MEKTLIGTSNKAIRSRKMATKPIAKTKKTTQPEVTKTPARKRESISSLKKRIAALEAQNTIALEDYGKLLSEVANMKLKVNAMLGQILKALFIIGIGPDELMAKCSQMFRKKVVAD